MTLDATVSISEETPLQNNKKETKTRVERLQDGTLMLTHSLPTVLRLSLQVRSLLWEVSIVKNSDTSEHLPKKEEWYFRDISDLDLWPTNGTIEVWTPNAENPDEYIVTRYKKLR